MSGLISSRCFNLIKKNFGPTLFFHLRDFKVCSIYGILHYINRVIRFNGNTCKTIWLNILKAFILPHIEVFYQNLCHIELLKHEIKYLDNSFMLHQCYKFGNFCIRIYIRIIANNLSCYSKIYIAS